MRRLAIRWTMGTLVSGLGVYLSPVFDVPTGATIVRTFGAVLLLTMAAARALFFRKITVGASAETPKPADVGAKTH
jgi:ABC-type Mn2+/Zn2+ transport system permease subunit